MASTKRGLSKLAKYLLTEHGYHNAMAEIFETLKSGECTRDQTSALIGARRCLEAFGDARKDAESKAEHEELLAELAAAKEALRARASGQTSFEGDPFEDQDEVRAPDGTGPGATWQ